jgi:ABC-2 type transport system permease protein
LPIIGTQYKLMAPEDLGKMINDSVESLIEIHDGLGYLADHRTAPLAGGGAGGPGQEDPQAYSNFRELIAQNYTLKPVSLSESSIPEGIACLLIVDPRAKFSDYDLFQIDQFLMQGKSLAVFADAFEEFQMPGQPPMFKPVDTGLERLLEHYGVRMNRSYVLDMNCYRQELPAQLGGGDRPIYFAPIIKNQFINGDLKFMRNVKGIVAVKVSALELLPERIQGHNLKAYRLLASSEQSWEMRDRINLDPMFLRPPSNPEEMKSRPLAFLIEGEFPSFFAGKPLPEREATEKKADETPAPASAQPAAEPPKMDLAGVERKGPFTAKGKPGKVFILGSSEMLKNVVIDESGRGVNTVFALNTIDYLNNREDVAVMRAKEQRFNPLSETGAGVKTFIKSFNIAGLPLLVCLFGIGVWFRRAARKKRLQAMFQ